ncbi:MAG: OmpA family protein [Betaproteobacteria bacterium]|jgi:outer membrane protein OmpA-like peptidoglycan-associated protein|nr:OmpA family protein [Flavobacteriales bacterium]MBT4386480.1 OmpA family protein [Betaproteobacteria bacterium]NCG29839.1 OmpA family protein [Bacteroidota bacterium]MBT3964492.1 OmpA family protein [Flavobacteriales bacterium]MBT4705730.1 OmpA family protein [Flavobacteriales bacterium]
MRALIVTLLSLVSFVGFSQDYRTEDKRAIKYYQEAMNALQYGNYEIAEVSLEKALARDDNFLDAKFDIAQLYLFTERQAKAKSHLVSIFKTDPAFEPVVGFTLGTMEIGKGKYELAEWYFRKTLDIEIDNPKLEKAIRLGLANCLFAKEAVANPVEFNPQNLGGNVNSKTDEYFPALTADESRLLFTRLLSSRESPDGKDEDFFFCNKSGDEWGKAYNPGPPINTPFKEGAPTLSPDGKYIIFTACELYGTYSPGKKGFGSCDLFISVRNGERWSKPMNMGRTINSPHWETQPSFASDGKTLYFIRGKRTKKGVTNSDIYMSELVNGRWSKAMPLPDNINSGESEESVFIHPDNQTLYFSSRGHVGMGDMDIYLSRRKEDGTWGDPINLGYPINTQGQENSFHVSASGNYGLIASDREGGFGGLDLYSFELPEHVRPNRVTYLKGKITDAKTGQTLEAKFELIDLASGDTVVESYSDKKDGSYLVVLPASKRYALIADKDGYLYHSENFELDLKENKTHYTKNIKMQPIEAGSKVVLKNVFFDTDKFDLKPESLTELNKLSRLMQSNASIKIEVSGHTDNQGNATANQVLSENRAKAVVEFLIRNGIEESRLAFAGYGQNQPIATNDTDEGRQLNRRTEFMVIE